MADVRKPIPFNTSMTSDKRAENFAYLRRNVLDTNTPGLYPAVNFEIFDPSISNTNYEIIDILGSTEGSFKVKVLVSDGAGGTKFYNLGSSSESNTAISTQVAATAFGSDGVYFVDQSLDAVFRVNHSNSNISAVGSAPAGSFNVEAGKFDGLQYWWVGGDIYSQLPGQTPVRVAPSIVPGNVIVYSIEFYQNYLVIFCQMAADIYVYFHDKANSTFFSDRIIISNARFIASGVVSGELMCVYSTGNVSNSAELKGKINASVFNGRIFKVVNSILAGDDEVKRGGDNPHQSFYVGEDFLYFSVNKNNQTNTRTDIFSNYVYKVNSIGEMEVVTLPVTNGLESKARIVRYFYSYVLYTTPYYSSTPEKIYRARMDMSSPNFISYNNYYGGFNETTYITNFLEDPNGYYRLDNVSISFEKLFRNGATSSATDEELLIYYRVSDRVDWTLMATINAQTVIDNVNKRLESPATVPINEQRYQITKMPDGSALPEFNEIQFKFISKRGFSVIGAWYDMSYISRNKISP